MFVLWLYCVRNVVCCVGELIVYSVIMVDNGFVYGIVCVSGIWSVVERVCGVMVILEVVL